MLDLLRSWATFTKVTVAHIERMHAINEHAFTGVSKLMSVEGGILRAYLRRWMRAYTDRGGTDYTLPRTARGPLPVSRHAPPLPLRHEVF